MRLLLDTHIALWAVTDSPKLPLEARHLIEDSGNDIAVSVASLWEIAIKHALKRKGKGAMPVSADAARGYFVGAGYSLVTVNAEHAVAVGTLPLHHGDPFDRMLIAQAISEPMRLLTVDKSLARYGSAVSVV